MNLDMAIIFTCLLVSKLLCFFCFFSLPASFGPNVLSSPLSGNLTLVPFAFFLLCSKQVLSSADKRRRNDSSGESSGAGEFTSGHKGHGPVRLTALNKLYDDVVTESEAGQQSESLIFLLLEALCCIQQRG